MQPASQLAFPETLCGGCQHTSEQEVGMPAVSLTLYKECSCQSSHASLHIINV